MSKAWTKRERKEDIKKKWRSDERRLSSVILVFVMIFLTMFAGVLISSDNQITQGVASFVMFIIILFIVLDVWDLLGRGPSRFKKIFNVRNDLIFILIVALLLLAMFSNDYLEGITRFVVLIILGVFFMFIILLSIFILDLNIYEGE